jgi:pilus assembly protein CpaF
LATLGPEVSSPSYHKLGPAFAVVVTEKGGPERREVYSAAELIVGRLPGVGLVLPKGNVSKRHARLLYRDGRFVVADLNSTNGTYVNRRRITQPTIVRDGDRIYIGDYILRIEPASDAEQSSARQAMISSSAKSNAPPSSAQGESSDVGSVRPAAASGVDAASSRLPAAARLPQFPTIASPPAPVEAMAAEEGTGLPVRLLDETATPEIRAQRQFLVELVRRAALALPQGTLDGELAESGRRLVEAAVDQELQALMSAGAAQPAGLPVDQARRLACEELIELGPLGPLLADPQVTTITVSRHDRIHVERDGRHAPLPLPYTSPSSVERVARRLVAMSRGLEERAPGVGVGLLHDGTNLTVLHRPAAMSEPVVLLSRRRPAVRSVEELVRQGVLSRAMVIFLHQCLLGRANVLIVGADHQGATSLVSGLSSLCDDPNLYVASTQGNLGLPEDRAVPLRLTAKDATEPLFNLLSLSGAGRVIVELEDSLTIAKVLTAAAGGVEGLIAMVVAPSLRRAMARLATQLVVENPGLSASAARDWLETAFPIGIEVRRLADGRHRVTRVAELARGASDEVWLKDVFTFSVERTLAGGAVEGAFSATGAVPRLTEELSSRGVEVEPSLFTRVQR